MHVKFVIMERADKIRDDRRAEKMRHGITIAFTLAVHAALFSTFSFVPDKILAIPTAPIPVKLVVLDIPPPADTVVTKETPPPPKPASPPAPPDESLPMPVNPPVQQPQTEVSPEAENEAESEPSIPATSIPLSILSTEDTQIGEPIPDRWRLPGGARIPQKSTRQPQNPSLETLSKSLDCLGFDAACAAQRKSVFADDQLTETDLVWMLSYAHSGLSDSSLYGLSEAQIRERLGIPTAGKNGFMIFPGIGIDGPLWDALHGVNKACEYGIAINDVGAKQLMKNCKPLKPSSRDTIGFIPKPPE